MKLCLFALLILLSNNCYAICPRIFNGESCNYYQSSVVYLSSKKSFCSGTLIAPNIVLTAAHCKPAATTATVAGHFAEVVEFIRHPSYKPFTKVQEGNYIDWLPLFDVAIAKLDRQLPVKVAKVAFKRRLKRGLSVETAGYGLQESGLSPPEIPVWTALKVTRIKINWIPKKLPLFESPYRATNSGACYGDSGGPAISRGKVIGIVSYGTTNRCSSWREVTGYTRTNHRKVRRFLKKHLNGTS